MQNVELSYIFFLLVYNRFIQLYLCDFKILTYIFRIGIKIHVPVSKFHEGRC
ncbi:hypothetical protein HanRHA438_Chr17g0837251 [Helianthus annuus]|nr:hypothetical protein HanRHA438_Chr17g0837251 [Helianthus annuus]